MITHLKTHPTILIMKEDFLEGLGCGCGVLQLEMRSECNGGDRDITAILWHGRC